MNRIVVIKRMAALKNLKSIFGLTLASIYVVIAIIAAVLEYNCEMSMFSLCGIYKVFISLPWLLLIDSETDISKVGNIPIVIYL